MYSYRIRLEYGYTYGCIIGWILSGTRTGGCGRSLRGAWISAMSVTSSMALRFTAIRLLEKAKIGSSASVYWLVGCLP